MLGGFLSDPTALFHLCAVLQVGYRWMTAFPQLTSRLCHRHKLVHGFLSSTLCAITKAFPPQALWMLVGLSKSPKPLRAQRALAVIKPYRQESAANGKYVGVAELMVDEFIKVASDLPPEGAGAYVLRELVDNTVFRGSGIILPLLSSLTVSLTPKAGNFAHGDGFLKNPPMIQKFERQVDVSECASGLTCSRGSGRVHLFCALFSVEQGEAKENYGSGK